MKVAALLIALAATSFGAASLTTDASTPTVLFRDTFDGTALNLAKWQPNWYGANNTTATKPTNSAERACYRPSRVTVADGELHLELAAKVCTVGGTTYPESTGAVTTLHSFSFASGTLTARVWLAGTATTLYNWPAVWTDGFPTWPHNGESDVMEGLGGRGCWHYHSDAGGPGGCVTLGQGWHTFSETVRSGTATYSYDGAVVGSTASVNAPHFIILANQSGTYGGKDVPGTMRVAKIVVTA